jgi:hypothetical protein
MTFHSWLVFRRSITKYGLSVEREFWWWIEPDGEPLTRRWNIRNTGMGQRRVARRAAQMSQSWRSACRIVRIGAASPVQRSKEATP